MKIKKRSIWGIIITVILLFILLRFVSWAEIWATLQKLPFEALVVAFFIYFLVYFFRTWRYYTLNLKNVKFSRLFSIIGLYNMVNVFLPFKTGEVGYAYLLNKDGITYSQGIATLIIARLFDVFSILSIFFIAFLFFESPSPRVGSFLLTFFIVVFVLIVSVILLVIHKNRFGVFANKIWKFFNIEENKVVLFLQKNAARVADAVKFIGFGKRSFLVFFQSLILWGLMYYFAFFVLRSLGMELTILQSVIGSSIALLLILIPIQGIAGFGTTEGALTIAFVVLGFQIDPVILYSFSYHILSLFFSIIFGLLGLIMYRKPKTQFL
jgi:glycosyltransferase 2 family protein